MLPRRARARLAFTKETTVRLLIACLAGTLCFGCASTECPTDGDRTMDTASPRVELGAFSVSLAVKDLEASKAFYAHLGFEPTGGDGEHWLVLRNSGTTIGLFQGMFENNILTFNPGWTQGAEPLASFQDVRDIQRHLKERGVTLVKEADPDSTGVEHIILTDPDGNVIMLDQHVPRP